MPENDQRAGRCLTPEERAAAWARCRAATPPPWYDGGDHGPMGLYPDTPQDRSRSGWSLPLTVANRRFIAAARHDLPAALADLDRQEAEIARLRATKAVLSFSSMDKEMLESMMDSLAPGMRLRLEHAGAEIARLRAALSEIAQETGTPYGRIAQAALDGGADG